MLPSAHIILAVFHGETMVGLIIYTALTGQDMRIFYIGLKTPEQDR